MRVLASAASSKQQAAADPQIMEIASTTISTSKISVQPLSRSSPSLRHRFVRLNPRFDRDESLRLLTSEINSDQPLLNETKYPLPVPWLNSSELQLEFFAIPADFRLNRSTSFQSGRVYGMDVTSGAAVATLLFDLFDSETPEKMSENAKEKIRHRGSCDPLRILDLCCAPGIKLCMLADLSPPSSILVGVDISSHRISLCKNIIKKYQIDSNISASIPKSTSTNGVKSGTDEKDIIPPRVTIRLYCADGTKFGTNQSTNGTTLHRDLVFDCNAAVDDHRSSGGKRKRMNKSARAREKRRLLELQRSEMPASTIFDHIDNENNTMNAEKTETINSHSEILSGERNTAIVRSNEKEIRDEEGFDRVIVDAECSTDGAMRHNEKRHCALPSKASPIWNDANMDELIDLQKRLIDSGFRLLRRGGVMVYSTCSLSSEQNEQVVQWLLEKCLDAYIIPVSFSKRDMDTQDLSFIQEGSLSGTVRFSPIFNDDTGMQLIQGSGFFLAKIGKTV